MRMSSIMLPTIVIAALSLFSLLEIAETGKAKKELRSGGLDMYFKYKDHFEKQAETSDDISLPFTRETYLYSRASKSYVQIIGRRVNANGARTEYARFLVESDNFGRVRFKGIQSGRYLCMTKTGKLITKADRRNKRQKQKKDNGKRRSYKVKKMRRCIFKEVYKSAYIAFQLVAHDSWYIAMDKNGQPRRGPRTRGNSKEIHFIERPIGVRRDRFQVSERSRPRVNRRKLKRKKLTQLYQKAERSWPFAPTGNAISRKMIANYIEQFASRKASLNRAIQSLRQLKVKVGTAMEEKDQKVRTRKLSTYSTELNSIITKLAKPVSK